MRKEKIREVRIYLTKKEAEFILDNLPLFWKGLNTEERMILETKLNIWSKKNG